MIGSIILVILGVMALIGIGASAVRDFGVPAIALVLVVAAIVGLNFIPAFTLGSFTFSLGTALLVVIAFSLWLFRGTWKNKIVCLLVSIVLTGALYGAMRLSERYGATLWSTINVYYGLMVGAIAFLVTRNAKYGFIASVLSVFSATLLSQIGAPLNLDAGYSWAVVAGGLSVVAFCFVSAVLPKRPSKLTYYFESGRMKE